MTEREALKLALEALEVIYDRAVFDYSLPADHFSAEGAQEAITAIKEALAQPEQEPYAWEFAGTIFHDRKEVFDWYERGDISDIPPLALYTTPPQPEQEPVAWLDEYGNAFPLAAKQYSVVGKHWKPLYTTPPQRTWVGLTDEDKQTAFDETQEGGGFWEFADAIEAKLKEKNT